MKGARYAGNGGHGGSGEGRGRTGHTGDAVERGLVAEKTSMLHLRGGIFLGNPASVANERERVDGPACGVGAQRWGIAEETEGGKGGPRYRQLAGSYIELRSGAYLSTSPSNLSPRLSPAFSPVRHPFSRYSLRTYFTSNERQRVFEMYRQQLLMSHCRSCHILVDTNIKHLHSLKIK